MLSKTCVVCDKVFTAKYASFLKKRLYCGKECAVIGVHKKQESKTEIICENCKKVFNIKKSHANKRKTCSLTCASVVRSIKYRGENHPYWSGGSKYVKGTGSPYIWKNGMYEH